VSILKLNQETTVGVFLPKRTLTLGSANAEVYIHHAKTGVDQ